MLCEAKYSAVVKTMLNFDVVVVGAGLAGLQCVRLLARAGVKVLLVDRKSALDTSIHTTGIFVRRTLEDFNIPEDCLGPPIKHVSLYSPFRRRMDLESNHDEFRIGRMGPLYERYLDLCVRAGAAWMPETRYSHCSRNGSRITLRLERRNSTLMVSTRYLVGADGANSRVARQLCLERNIEWIVGVEDVFTNVSLDGPPRLHCFLDPQLAPGYIAWVANDGHETHIGVGGYAARFDPIIALDKFRSTLNTIVDLKHAVRLERRGGRIPVGGVLRHIANVNGLLVGDAAGAVSPLTAGGLDPCLRLSTLAAQVICEYLQTNDPRVLQAYSGEAFRTKFTSRLWMRRIVTRFTNRHVLETAFIALNLPPFNRLAAHVFFGRGSFPDMGLTSDQRKLIETTERPARDFECIA